MQHLENASSDRRVSIVLGVRMPVCRLGYLEQYLQGVVY